MNTSIPLHSQLVSILSANREDSYATQRKRGYCLAAAATKLHVKFGLQKWDNLKAKHVAFLIERFKMDDTGRRSIDEKLTHLRWLVRKIGKANLVPRTNVELGVTSGPRHTRAGKAISDDLLREIVDRIDDPRLRIAINLGRHLGLRFREAMLLRPGQDWNGGRVWVKRGSKGGRPRYLFLHNDRQREVLAEAKALVGVRDASLVPAEVPTFEKWRQRCYRELRAAGMGRATDALFHDLRRTYAVERMDRLVLEHDIHPSSAAALLSRELGHSRVEILQWYLADRGQDSGSSGISVGSPNE